jgi:hypothetical protein
MERHGAGLRDEIIPYLNPADKVHWQEQEKLFTQGSDVLQIWI